MHYFLFALVNPKFPIHLSVKLFQEGSPGPAPASWVQPKVDVRVVLGLPPLLQTPSFAPKRMLAGKARLPPLSATPFLSIPARMKGAERARIDSTQIL